MNPHIQRATLPILILLAVGGSAVVAREPEPGKLQVFILAGQSNMVGHANFITIPRLFVDERPEVRDLAQLVFKPGKTVTRADVDRLIAARIARDELNRELRSKTIQGDEAIAAARSKLEELQKEVESLTQETKGTFAVAENVYISSIADNNRKSGPLTVGFGANNEKIGPELGFGMSMAQRIDGPILIIKTSWGGKSLNYNFRPPSAGPYELSEKELASEKSEKIKEDAGLNYRLMMQKVREVLENIEEYHPGYDPDIGYDVAGFVWFQGFNDQFSPAFRDNYQDNMITFVKDIRSELKTPELPFVIGVLGTGITAEAVGQNAVSLAQRAAASAPEFEGNVAAVESYEVFDLSALEVFKKGWRENFAEWCAVGSDRPYHYLGSGKFFVRFGDALADAMSVLIANQ